ncbi:MAG: DNA-directed RNA polymerase subunit H [Candidatus Marsarchaeota archaeon]|nr:DNA-directed RNA polymerase subunit H [Candidatus Marsarchaeota archaeon]
MSNPHSTVHYLVPRAELASDEDLKKLSERGITKSKLPLIRKQDPGIKDLSFSVGQVVKFYRQSQVTGKEEEFFRLIVE